MGGGGTAGTSGGYSSVSDGTNTITANGGSSNTNSNTGGAGGAASSGGIITASYAGGNGGNGSTGTNRDAGGGGGGSASIDANGGDGDNGVRSNTSGGAGGTGTGNGGDGGASDNTPAAQSGYAPGGGGGGRGENNGGNPSSGSGADGQVILSWQYSTSSADVTIAITSGSNPTCSGANVTFTATPINGGSSPTYQWYSGSNPIIGEINSTYSSTTLVNGEVISCEMTSSSSCASPATATSTPIIITLSSNANAGTVSAGTSPQCIGETTTYTVSGEVLGGGTGGWTSDDPGVATVDASTGVVTAVGSGTCNIIYTVTGGCGGDVSHSQPYTVTPNVETPTAITISSGTEPSCQLTNGTTTTTYATTATNNTGFNWSLSNASAGNINSSGVMTWADGFSGSVDIQVTADGCNGPSAITYRTVTVYSITATISAITSDWECPELIPAQGFMPDNDAPYNAGTTKLIFRVTRGSSTSAWSFSYTVSGGSVNVSYFPNNPASATVNVNAGDNFIDMIFFVNNTPGSAQSIVFEITSVNDTDHSCSTNYALGSNTQIINISAMPAVGPYSP